MHALRLGAAQREAREADLHDDRFAAERAVRDEPHRLAGDEAQFAKPAADRIDRPARNNRAHPGRLPTGKLIQGHSCCRRGFGHRSKQALPLWLQMISVLIKLALTEITEPAGSDPACSGPGSDMYVCICHAVTDREIRAAVAGGAARLEDLTMTLGVGAGCGCCREAAVALIDERLVQIEESETSSIAA